MVQMFNTSVYTDDVIEDDGAFIFYDYQSYISMYIYWRYSVGKYVKVLIIFIYVKFEIDKSH